MWASLSKLTGLPKETKVGFVWLGGKATGHMMVVFRAAALLVSRCVVG